MRPNRSHTVRNPHLLPNFATLARERLPTKKLFGAIALAQPLHIQASLAGLRQLMQAVFDVSHAACGP